MEESISKFFNVKLADTRNILSTSIGNGNFKVRCVALIYTLVDFQSERYEMKFDPWEKIGGPNEIIQKLMRVPPYEIKRVARQKRTDD